MKAITALVIFLCVSRCLGIFLPQENKSDRKPESRQSDYMSLINLLLQETNALSSVNGALLAATTVIASLIIKLKPFFIASGLWYLLYIGAVLLFPEVFTRLGLPTLQFQGRELAARFVDATESTAFDGILSDTLTKGIQNSPVKSILTNVTISVVTETVAMMRTLARSVVQNLSLLQNNVVWVGKLLSSECVSRFMCRVGQFTNVNLPRIASLLRSLADNYPGMDDFAVAMVRGTSSSNCSLIYPDCVVPSLQF